MGQPSQHFATHYQLQLERVWQTWFDTDGVDLTLPGSFRAALQVDGLTSESPTEIWPGFMLPDTLPVLGNEYGDWICVRVTADNRLGELIHWYHGGGDWIPVGTNLAEAILHDTVDQFRPLRNQMLRGAAETLEPMQQGRALLALEEPRLIDWLVRNLTSVVGDVGSVSQSIQAICSALKQNDYVSGLAMLREQHWASDAVACDLIEQTLQSGLTQLANPKIAKHLEMNWTPDYVRWLFDVADVPVEERTKMAALLGFALEDWPVQNWKIAGDLAREVLQRRGDLGWAFNIAGWAQQRAGNQIEAASIYFQGRHASAFSDQAVRLRTHWCESRFGKFTVTQLESLYELLAKADQADSYLATVWQTPEKLRLNLIQEFWLQEGRKHLAADNPERAYENFYRAGWDFGVQRLSEYSRILELLVQSASAAGWTGRATVAQTHLACLRSRHA